MMLTTLLLPAAAANIILFGALLFCHATLADAAAPQACTDDKRNLNFGFYAFFAPVSYSADEDSAAAGFHTHLGYEADLLSALEAMEGVGLSFSRRPIAAWDDIWLQPAGRQYDMVGGGITILASRTRDTAGKKAVGFTSGHIAFRQSLLVRAEDAHRLASHDDLSADVRVGALASTTGEARLLQLTGLADANGILAAGVRIDTPRSVVTTDGSDLYRITASAESPSLSNRTRLYPPAQTMPKIIYLGAQAGEIELLEALGSGRIDAIARGEIGNRDAAHASNNAFVVTALDPEIELGGFTVATKNTDLLSCIDDKINLLTDNRRIGYGEWLDDPKIFMRRAQAWNDEAR